MNLPALCIFVYSFLHLIFIRNTCKPFILRLMYAVLIDDSPEATLALKTLLRDVAPDVQVAGEATNIADAIKLIRKHEPQIVFSDIEMPVLSGLQLLDFFNEEDISFELIFVTNYSEYAVKAFQLSAIDYLLKPVEAELLSKAIDKVRLRKNYRQTERNMALKQIVNTNRFEKIALPLADGLRFVEIDTIAVMKADNVYTEVELITGETILVSKPLKSFEKILVQQLGFFRTHRTYLINLKAVKTFVRSDGGVIIMENDRQVPIARDRKDEFTKAWEGIRIR
ncbi:MAG TPA: response regulator [Chitinophagales bacterium]|nr:response regulator [Chitinophagales bacterium]